MVFWVAIIAGSVGAFFGIKKHSFYALWAILFNLMLSIFIGVMLARPIAALLEESTAAYGYNLAVSILLISAIAFAFLQVIAVSFFTSYELQFPKFLDTVGSAILGFIIGFLTCSYILFVICIMPVSKTNFMTWLNGPNGPPAKTAVIPVARTCNLIAIVSLQRHDDIAAPLLEEILGPDQQTPQTQPQTQPQQDPNETTQNYKEDGNIDMDKYFPPD